MATKGLKRGIFITFEGVEGCGKSTHSKFIYKYLRQKGYMCVYTKEPGGTKIGERIRKMLLDPANKTMADATELFLFEASRSQLVAELIRPALKRKTVVICDRFFDSTMAYQGYGNGLNKNFIKRLSKLATGGLKPDLTIILDLDIKKGLRRATRTREKDRIERKSFSFHNRVRKGHIAIAKKEPRRVRLIRTMAGVKDTQERVRREVLNVIQRYKAAR